jgi:restriction system protein
MSRHGFGATLRLIAREAARAERAAQHAAARDRVATARVIHDAERQNRADLKEAARLHAALQIEEAEELSRAIVASEAAMASILSRALAKNPAVEFAQLRRTFTVRSFAGPPWPPLEPRRETYSAAPLGFFGRLVPGAAGRHQKQTLQAERRYEQACQAYNDHLAATERARLGFVTQQETARKDIESHNATVDEMERGLYAGDRGFVVDYYQILIERSLGEEHDATSADVGYSADSRHLVVDLELPDLSVVPDQVSFKYVKSADRIDEVARSPSKRKALYANLLYQVVLKGIDTVYRGGRGAAVECLTLNGMLDTIDPATGQQVHLCLLSVRVTKDNFRELNLAHVQPDQCLRSLKASISRAPAELLPVKPLLELDMVDPRFVNSPDVLAALEGRPNLMDLSPSEFEGLITNLFGTMGLETRLTRPSRDGGVDCVAFDSRPIVGGKVVIQAKRYKNTVGVSAVRDLFGTVQNEGASKGILVTTSGYGKAAFEFAKGKPLELLDGGNLLYLLSQHAKIEARIVMPDAWTDLPIHGK